MWYHITIVKKLVQRLPGLLRLHGYGDPVLLWQRADRQLHLLDHLHLLLSITALSCVKHVINMTKTCHGCYTVGHVYNLFAF